MLLTNTLSFLIRNLADFFILVLLARFYLQAAQVSLQQPLGRFVLALSNWIVLPLRRILPPLGSYDTASLMLAILCALAMQLLLLAVAPWSIIFSSPMTLLAIAAVSVLEVIKMSLYLLFAAVLAHALLSWIAPHSPLQPTLQQLTAPFLRPLRRMIPPVGGVDISPLILLLLVQLMLNVFIAELELRILQYVQIVT
jgi:YggT family protein